jgi:hypothetical protein
VYVFFFQPDFCEPETCDEPGSWEEKLAEEFRNEKKDFSARVIKLFILGCGFESVQVFSLFVIICIVVGDNIYYINLHCAHLVTIWNRTTNLCADYVGGLNI